MLKNTLTSKTSQMQSTQFNSKSSSSSSNARSEQAPLAENRQHRSKKSASSMELPSSLQRIIPVKRRTRARRIPIWEERSCFSPREPRPRKRRCRSLSLKPNRLSNSSSSWRQVSESGCRSTRCARQPPFTLPRRRTVLASHLLHNPLPWPPPANRKANKWSPV